jgi:assimilatory nitrate reductase catalytic subunit
MQFTQDNTCYLICLQAGKLVFLCYSSVTDPTIESAWLEHIFSQTSLPDNDIQSLLSGTSSEEFAKGKQICSCFNVGEKEIISAIEGGCGSVEQLGATLQCGTNCGSCKSELGVLLNEHKVNGQDTIKSTFIEESALVES